MMPKAGPISVTGARSSWSGSIVTLWGGETAHDHADVVGAAAFVTQVDQALGRLSRRVAADKMANVLVPHQTVQAIATEHDHVRGQQVDWTTRVHVDFGSESDTAGDDVAAFTHTGLLASQGAAAARIFDPRVVAGQALHAVCADEIGAAVADVGPP